MFASSQSPSDLARRCAVSHAVSNPQFGVSFVKLSPSTHHPPTDVMLMLNRVQHDGFENRYPRFGVSGVNLLSDPPRISLAHPHFSVSFVNLGCALRHASVNAVHALFRRNPPHTLLSRFAHHGEFAGLMVAKNRKGERTWFEGAVWRPSLYQRRFMKDHYQRPCLERMPEKR